MSRHEAKNTDPRAISPKVVWGVAAGLALSAASAGIAEIGSEQLAPLGVWAGPIGAVLATLSVGLAAIAKADPARTGITADDVAAAVEEAVARAGGHVDPDDPDLAYRPGPRG